VRWRDPLTWKFWFYHGLLPALRRLGAARSDAVLDGIGRISAVLWPPRRAEQTAALARARLALRAEWRPEALRPELAANSVRFLARDYPLDVPDDDDDAVLARFEIKGDAALRASIAEGRGAILVGSHLGAHIAAVHGLYRLGVPLRLLVQRPNHVSRYLNRRFDRDEAPHPQSDFFLRRTLAPGQAVERLVRARAALRDGLAVYLTGDIPWSGPNSRPGRLLGQSRTFLAVWAELAALTRAPVFHLFCTHRPGGRFALTIDPPQTVAPGDEAAAVARYLARLDAEIAAHPADAVAHLLWPCYGPPHAEACAGARAQAAPALRPGRRVAPLPHL
jgi:lauroyl/myristoyl acyltransferase